MPKITKNNKILQSLIEQPGNTALKSPAATQQQIIALIAQPASVNQNRDVIMDGLSNLSSLSAYAFTTIFKKLLLILTETGTTDSMAMQKNICSICSILLLIANHNYDLNEVICEFKRTKGIDAVFMLALMWKYYTIVRTQQPGKPLLSTVMRVIDIIVCSYPVDLMINGKQYLRVWNDLLKKEIHVSNQTNEVLAQINSLLLEKGVINKGSENGVYKFNLVNFTDIYIPL